MREGGAQESGRVLQPFARVAGGGLGPEDGEENLRVRLVPGYFHAGEGDHADARVAKLEPDDLGELALDLVGDSGAAGSGHCRL
jgi:hypothetical protein